MTLGWPEDFASSVQAPLVSASTHSTCPTPPLGGAPCPLGPPPPTTELSKPAPGLPKCILCMDTHLPVFFTFMIRTVLVSKVSPCIRFQCSRCFFSFNPKYPTSYHTLCPVMWGPERCEMSRAHSREVETDQRGRHSRGRRWEVSRDKQRTWSRVGPDTLIPGEVVVGGLLRSPWRPSWPLLSLRHPQNCFHGDRLCRFHPRSHTTVG